MPKVLVDCGNCGPDFNAIRRMAEVRFNAVVVQTHGPADTLQVLKEQHVDLVTVNRKLDRDYSDGLDVVKQIKADPEVGDVPVMLVTNFAEFQQLAIKSGCHPGFGKLSLGDTATHQLLEPFLGE